MVVARFIDGPTQIQIFNRRFDGFLETLRKAIIGHGGMPPRVVHEFPLSESAYGETHVRFLYMPAMYERTAGFKLLAYPLPKQRRSSTVQGLTVVLDNECAIQAVLDARTLTSLRTAGVTALGAKLLAKRDVRRIGLVGFGLLGRAHLAVLSRIYPDAMIFVHHPRASAVDEYRRAHPEYERLRVAKDLSDAVREVDILITMTTSTVPFVDSDAVHSGMLYCQIGRDQECTQDAVRAFDRLVCDDWEQTRSEGHKSLAKAYLSGLRLGPVTDLGQILSGQRPGRLTTDESIMLSCTGLSVEDIATAKFIADHAVSEDLVLPLDLSYVGF